MSKIIILASQSPRRKILLEQAGYSIEVKPTHADETYDETMPVAEVAPWLAQKKAIAAAPFWYPNTLILAADSVVILDDIVYGKPEDEADARRILRALSGRCHEVITGVCVYDGQHFETRSERTLVWMDSLSEDDITYYLENYQPYDKAGSYAIQEWIGLCKISRIEGTYSNIMGLPMHLVYEMLQKK